MNTSGDEAKLACIEALLAHTTDNIYFKDRESRFLLVSDHMAHWCGRLSAAEMVGLTDADLFAPAHANEALADEQALLRADAPFIRKEERETWPDGRITWVSTIKLPLPNREGEVIGTFGISRDITQQKNAETQIAAYRDGLEQMVAERTRDLESTNRRLETEIAQRGASETALKDSEQRYRRLLESVTDYVYGVEIRAGRPVSTHHGPGCEAVTGYPPEDFERNPYLWIDMVHPDDRAAVLRQSARLLEGLDAPPVEHRIRRKDGAVRWVRNTPVRRRSADGAHAGYDGLVKDITERRETEEARLQAERVLHQAREREMMERADRLASLGLLAAGVAHEVNNPLQGMLSHLETVRRALPDTFPRLNSLDMVGRGIRTIAELVQRLLWLGSARADEGEVSDFAEAVDFVRDLLATQFAKAGVRLDVRARALHVNLAIPHRELVQVLLNLLMNARDAMPGGGTVTLTCDREGSTAAISIADTGIGIPPDVIAQIFTPFFTTKGAKGIGLGLSMAESILRARHGTITVASPPGAGATFTLRLPISEGPA